MADVTTVHCGKCGSAFDVADIKGSLIPDRTSNGSFVKGQYSAACKVCGSPVLRYIDGKQVPCSAKDAATMEFDAEAFGNEYTPVKQELSAKEARAEMEAELFSKEPVEPAEPVEPV